MHMELIGGYGEDKRIYQLQKKKSLKENPPILHISAQKCCETRYCNQTAGAKETDKENEMLFLQTFARIQWPHKLVV